MARKLVQYIEITDDFDRGSPADETVEIAIDGTVYELDLSTAKAKELREFLSSYQEVAHDQWKMPLRPGKKRAVVAKPAAAHHSPNSVAYGAKMRDKEVRNNIRTWAAANGHHSARTGKIPVETLKAYLAANPNAYVPQTTLVEAGLQDAV